MFPDAPEHSYEIRCTSRAEQLVESQYLADFPKNPCRRGMNSTCLAVINTFAPQNCRIEVRFACFEIDFSGTEFFCNLFPDKEFARCKQGSL